LTYWLAFLLLINEAPRAEARAFFIESVVYRHLKIESRNLTVRH